ncbi:hypothetical protein BX666DRAFT_1873113, partial [Dichotomocladium elegans]
MQSAPTNSKLISVCRPTVSLDPILWLPMTREERSRCLRWRLGWLPSGNTTYCIRHPSALLTKTHSIQCLNMHSRLQQPQQIDDPLSYLLNQLPNHPPRQPTIKRQW